MAIAYDVLFVEKGMNYKATVTKVTGDASYSAGGYTLDAASCGLSRIDSAEVTGVTGVGIVWTIDRATGKLFGMKTGSATSGQFIEAVGADVTTADIVNVRCVEYASHAAV